MPIREKSFRIGCGRYLQEAGILATLGAEVCRLGTSALIVGGKTALSITSDTIKTSLDGASVRYRIAEHRGTCNDEDAQTLATLAKKEGYDVIVGVGGGVIMDFSKMVAHFADAPLINVPTSAATCAADSTASLAVTLSGLTAATGAGASGGIPSSTTSSTSSGGILLMIFLVFFSGFGLEIISTVGSLLTFFSAAATGVSTSMI